MAKERTGFVVEKNGKLYTRISYTDSTGKRRELMRRAADKKEARQILKTLSRQLDGANRETELEAERVTFGQIAERYSENRLIPAEYQGDKKIAGLRSLNSPKLWMKRLIEHFGKRRLQSVTYNEIEAYKRERLRSGLTIASVNRELELLRAVLNFAKREGLLERTPFEMGVPLISKANETRRERVMSREEEERLLAVCVERRAHLRPLLIAAIDTGMRRGEILTLTWGDVDLPARVIRLRAFNTKTAKAREVPITNRLAIELERLRNDASGDALVFPFTDVKRSFNTACRLAKIEDLHLHDLRHTFATRLVQAGFPLVEVARLLGHSTLQMTFRYSNATAETTTRAASILDGLNAANAANGVTASGAEVTL